MNPIYSPYERVSLKSHATLKESWLQDRIAEDPTILGLGDLTVIERERAQLNAGRLDLLLSDGDSQRFEVEIQLGKTDPSHIIRTIEYWDIERRRYPGYDHVAVIVAEDITSRFLNVISLFSGSIPIVAIQLAAIQVGDHLTLHFARILDQRDLRTDDENPETEPPTDRSFWEAKSSPTVLGICDQVLRWINEANDGRYSLSYLKRSIGLHDGTGYTNFVRLFPRRAHVRLILRIADASAWAQECEEAGFDVEIDKKARLRCSLTTTSLAEQAELLSRMIKQATEEREA